MTSNATDTPGPAQFDTFEPLPTSAASFSGAAGFWQTSDGSMLHAFVGHLRRCRCPHFKRAKIAFHARFGVRLFHQRLVGCGICAIESVRDENADPALVTAFLDWFQTHRGAKPPTLRLYARGAAELLQALGDDVSQWTAHAVRNFLLFRARQCGSPTTQKLITSLRAFLRYLNFRGESRDDLALAIPAVAHWRLGQASTLPIFRRSEPFDRRL